jgi:electron transfer flavoprotein alpha subunit
MAGQVFVYIVHKGGVADDTALELLAAGEKIGAGAPTAVVAGTGSELDAVCTAVAASYSEVFKVDNGALSYPNAELIRKALVNVLPADAILLVPHNTFGMDLSPGLSIKMDSTFVADVVAIDGVDGDSLSVVRQEFGGQVSTNVTADMSNGIIINVRAGCFEPKEGGSGGQVVDKSSEAGDLTADRTFVEIVEAEVGDVDITKEEVLVAIGRGIEDEENIEIAADLAKAIGGELACSRPIVDAKWLENSRQVGTSGLTVKPRVYLACGISGSFQHIGGIKGNPFIVAINKNSKAPIFRVADVGINVDILDFLPKLTKALEEMKG